MFSKVIECLEQNIRKEIDCKRPSGTTQMNRVQNVRIEMSKYKYHQVRLVLAVFYLLALSGVSTKLYQSNLMQLVCR